jgi:predicted metalloprotease with PDZ domain
MILIGVASVASADDAYLGVQTQKLNKALLEAFDLDEDTGGVLINEVMEDSPAETAGFKRGDLITAIDGKTLSTPEELRRRVRSFDSGEEVTVAVLRRGESITLKVELGELDQDVAMGGNHFRWKSGDDTMHFEHQMDHDDMPGSPRMLFFGESRPQIGVSLHSLEDKSLGDYFKSDKGMLVLSVHEDSPADEAGFLAGDVIVEADGEEIEDIEDIHDILDEHEAGDTIEVSVIRKGKTKTLEVGLREGESMHHVFDELGSLHERMPGNLRRFELRNPDGNHFRKAPRVERRRLHESRDDLDELRDELKALRKELEELKEKG